MAIFAQVDIDAAGEREGYDQRRRHQVVGADFGVDAAFEVAIAGETDATTKSFSSIAFETSSGSGPELPMHVVHP